MGEPLTSAEKKQLRGYAQRLKPSLRIGRQGLSCGVFQEIEKSFEAQDLIKIRFEADREQVQEWADQIAARTGAECVGSVGKTASFFRQRAAPDCGPQ